MAHPRPKTKEPVHKTAFGDIATSGFWFCEGGKHFVPKGKGIKRKGWKCQSCRG